MTATDGTTPGAVSAEAIDAAEVVTRTDEIRLSNKTRWDGLWKQRCPEFMDMLSSLSGFGGNPIDAMELEGESSPSGPVHRASFYTETNRYTIVAKPKGKGYLGAVVSRRKPRAGEDWARGRDLSDGDYSIETWYNILVDIVAYEMVRLGK